MICPSCNRRASEGAVVCEFCSATLTPVKTRKREGETPGTKGRTQYRPLTVMFCDLVDSVALSQELEAEDLLDLMDRYQSLCEEIVCDRGGFLAKFMGDGVLAYFGYPKADEEDSANAVYAGLDIIAGIREMGVEHQIPMQVRVGIATGLVLVKDGGPRERLRNVEVVGKIPNLASRLQSAARPDTVLISDATRQVTRGFFSYRDVGTLALKGFPEPAQAWEVQEPDTAVSRFHARLLGQPTPFVGRQSEFEQLERAWARAREGRGQVVTVVGEAGIGKSRIVERFDESVAAGVAGRIRLNCAPVRQHSAFYPVVRQLQRAASIHRSDTTAVQLAKLGHLLGWPSPPDPTTAALFAGLLSTPWDGPSPLEPMTPDKRRDLTLDALTNLVLRGDRRRARIILVEDAHWIDASTLDLLDHIVKRIEDRPILLVVTARPEFKHPWEASGRAAVINLSRLDPASAAQVCAHVAAGTLRADVTARLVDRSDGNPFFMEELTRAVVESLSGDEGEDAGAARIPISLHESLVARLDRLGPARRIVDIGAVIGRQFDYEVLAAVASRPTAALRTSLGAVKRSGLVSQTGTPPASRYLFRHVLTRDAAYEAMIKADRRVLHDKVAAALQKRFPNLRETEPELIAHHLGQGDAPIKALPFWHSAGQKSAARGGHVEAIAHFNSALALLNLLPEGVERLQQELACLLPLAISLASSLGYAADEVGDVLTRAREICGLMGDASPLFPVLHGLSKFWTVRGDQVLAEQFIRTCATIAEQTRNPLYIVESDATLAYVLSITGQFGEELTTLLSRAPRIYDENESACRQNWSEANAKTSALSVAPKPLYVMGDAAEAERAYREAITWARTLDRPFDLAHTLCFTAAYQIARQDFQAAREEAEEAVRVCETYGFGVWLMCARAYKAIAMAQLGEVEAGRALMIATMADWKKAGCNTVLGYFTSHLALIEARLGHFDQALALAQEGIELDVRHHDFANLPDAYRALAHVLSRRPSPELPGAEAALRRGLDIARSQGARVPAAEIEADLAALKQPAPRSARLKRRPATT